MGIIDIVASWLVFMLCIFLGVKCYETILRIYLQHQKIAGLRNRRARNRNKPGSGGSVENTRPKRPNTLPDEYTVMDRVSSPPYDPD